MKRGWVAVIVLASAAPAIGDWRQFRGPAGSGTPDVLPSVVGRVPRAKPSKDAKAVEPAGPERNIAWKASLPGRGLSGPIVVGDAVIVTASSGPRQDRLHVLCFDRENGQKQWHRQFWATGRTACHPKTCVAAPTPASDGSRILALYSTNDAICLDLAGNVLWIRGLTRDYPNASNSVGMAASPLLVEDTAIVQLESQSDAFLLGIDAATGGNRWKVDRKRTANWTSPVLLNGDPPAVLVQGPQGVMAVAPRTGMTLWKADCPASTIPSSAADEGQFVVPAEGLTMFRRTGQATPEVQWKSNRLTLNTASPLLHRGRVYAINSSSVLKCADASSGEILWQLRLVGPFSSSPVIAGDRMICINEEGLVQVIALGSEGKVIGTGELGETILCSPAVSDNALYVRSDGHLWKIAETEKESASARR